MNKKTFLPKKADLIIIVLLLIVASVFFFMRNESGEKTVEIITDGNTEHSEIITQSTKSHTLTLSNGVMITIDSDGASFTQSDCKNKDCIKVGKIKNAGECAACLPNKTVIVIKSNGKRLTDAMTY